jgi:preprotein translocase subunit YajC
VTSILAILAAESKGNPIVSLLILGLPIAAIFYLMVIPQRKQRAKQQAFLAKLGVGDEVVTSGGVYGTITYIEDGVAHLEVDTDVVIRVAVSSLSRSAIAEDDAAASTASDDEGSSADDAADKKKAK